MPFLIRVGLAIVSCCRTQILESRSDETVLALLQHLHPNLLPSTSDSFLQLALSVKLKDDDVRKQRIKMEAQVKRQTQTPRMTSTHGSISLPRSWRPSSLSIYIWDYVSTTVYFTCILFRCIRILLDKPCDLVFIFVLFSSILVFAFNRNNVLIIIMRLLESDRDNTLRIY